MDSEPPNKPALAARDDGGFLDNVTILFVRAGAGVESSVAVCRVTSGTQLWTPYAPDEAHRFAAELRAISGGFRLDVLEQKRVVEAVERRARTFVSRDGGMTWREAAAGEPVPGADAPVSARLGEVAADTAV